MAVLCEAISVVVRRDSIDKYFKGGWVRFKQNIPNSTMCTDGELVRVGFMSPNAVQEYVESLEAGGLQFKEEKKFLGVFGKGRSKSDIVVVDQHQGPTLSCNWIEFGIFPLGKEGINVSMCWFFEGERIAAGTHMKSTRMDLHHPPGWTIELSRELTFSGATDFRSKYQFLRSENGLHVFLDEDSGKEVYIGVPYYKFENVRENNISNMDNIESEKPKREKGKKDGLRNNYYDNGQLKSKESYKDGKKDGFTESYHENGQLKWKGNFKDGEIDGLWEEYYDNGQLRWKGNWEDGKLEGLWEWYNEDGSIDTENTGTYKYGVKQKR